MRKLQTEVLVIGGGATGTGVFRDSAMRGFKAILVEKRDLSHGTTGRYHGLLHSGGRYAVKDPHAAKECIAENLILRRIMPQCIEDTGGFFVLTPWDDPNYVPLFFKGCQSASIPIEEIPTTLMLKNEPLLNPYIQRCFRVPDAAADSFLATELNVESGKQYGGQSLTYHEVIELIKSGDKIVGARCRDLIKDEEVQIQADMTVNASGAWAGKLSSTVGILVQILPGKGTMVAMNHRVVNTVINRCKMPSDGDIIVPIHTVAVIGTTDVRVSDPDNFAIEPWEIQLMFEEGKKLIPGLESMRLLRAWAGVRPLYQETQTSQSRDISRAYVLLDHEERDGIKGLITITSGKWTTYRLMAQAAVDLVCQKVGVQRSCRTHLEPLPGDVEQGYHYLGKRFAQVEAKADYGELICECELVTQAEVIQSITDGEAKTIDDVRRDTRLGMGPCQGGFCTYRIAGLLNRLHHPPIEEINVSLRDFLQERWKGLLPLLFGQQLRQERLDELIYLSLLNTDHLPGPKISSLSPDMYDIPKEEEQLPPNKEAVKTHRLEPYKLAEPINTFIGPQTDVIIIGAGLAGLTAAWKVSEAGLKVHVLTKGWGATHWHTGCVDVLGYHPIVNQYPVESPINALAQLIEGQSHHPYAICGPSTIREAIDAIKNLFIESGYPLRGTLKTNWLLPSSLGSIRPTCLAPETMIAGDLRRKDPMLIVGFEGLLDFYPGIIADNLVEQGFLAREVMLDLISLRKRHFTYTSTLSRLFETADFQAEVVEALKPKIGNANRVGFPAVLGIENPMGVLKFLQDSLDCEIFEIPTLPPSLPGIRMHNILVKAIESAGGSVLEGIEVLDAEFKHNHVNTVRSEAAARYKPHRAKSYILATGGILGGGTVGYLDGSIRETIFDLPISTPIKRLKWFKRDFFDHLGHPIFQCGIEVDEEFHPLDRYGGIIYRNLYATGNSLGYCDAIRERSFDGVALATGYAVADHVINQ